MDKIQKIYFKPNHLCIGKKAIKKLKKLTGLNINIIKLQVFKQANYQVHLPAPTNIRRPHYEITIPNYMHQFDLLYMPSDTLYGNKYKYILSGFDVASRYKVVGPLRSKKASDVAFLLNNIYENKSILLGYPKIFQWDNGNELKSDVNKLLEKNNVEVKRI